MFSSGISFLENGRCNGVMVKLLKSIKKRIEGLYIYILGVIFILVFIWHLNNLRFVPKESQLEISAILSEKEEEAKGKTVLLDVTVKNVGDKPVHNLHIDISANIQELRDMGWFVLDENRGSRVLDALDVGESINYKAIMGFEKFHSKHYSSISLYLRRLLLRFR